MKDLAFVDKPGTTQSGFTIETKLVNCDHVTKSSQICRWVAYASLLHRWHRHKRSRVRTDAKKLGSTMLGASRMLPLVVIIIDSSRTLTYKPQYASNRCNLHPTGSSLRASGS